MPAPTALNIADHGARHAPGALTPAELKALLAISDGLIDGAAGQRIFGVELIRQLCAPTGRVGALACSELPGARPVRAVLFDKTPARNWAVAWHQDRTIAVRRRIAVEGFGPWSTKAGLVHVEPPFGLLEEMVTIRIHLDDCGPDNAPLLIAVASHRLGRVAAAETAGRAQALEVVTCVAETGDVWLYATPILHASAKAATPARRRVLQVDFAAGGLPGGLEWAGI